MKSFSSQIVLLMLQALLWHVHCKFISPLISCRKLRQFKKAAALDEWFFMDNCLLVFAYRVFFKNEIWSKP
jgi:hypothetical protein